MTDYPFAVSLTASLPLGDLVADLTLESGAHKLIVLRDGYYQGTLPEAVVHLQLTAQGAPAGEPPLRTPDEASEASRPPAGAVSSVEELFEDGMVVSGERVELQLIWGLHCHRSVEVQPPAAQGPTEEGTSPERAIRFGSFEHITCAELVGLDPHGKMLTFAGRRAVFHYKTKLAVGKTHLTFGEVIALAGDYYAHLDEQAAQELKDTWPAPPAAVRLLAGDYRQPALRDDHPEITRDILKTTYRDKAASQDKLSQVTALAHDGLFGQYPVRRYLALASQNYCHFACQPPTGVPDDETNEALRLYRAYHARALALAEQSRAQASDAMFLDALVVDAFGCHFLTDLFATGHMRVPRRILSERYGIMRGAQGYAHEMHCEDNNLGLWCTTRIAETPRRVWRGFGDTKLFTKEAVLHFDMVKESVRRSAAEVFARFCGSAWTPQQSAEALIPVPLAAGLAPESEDRYPGTVKASQRPEGEPNHYPKFCWVPAQEMIARRTGTPQENLYEDQDGKRTGAFSLLFTGKHPTIGDSAAST